MSAFAGSLLVVLDVGCVCGARDRRAEEADLVDIISAGTLLYLAEPGSSGCPDVQDLVAGAYVVPDARYHESKIVIRCEGDRVVVQSISGAVNVRPRLPNLPRSPLPKRE